MSGFPIPGFLPEPRDALGDVAELALELYRELAAARREAADAAQRADDRIEAHVLSTGGTIAALAAERFEFDRLLKRVQAEIETLGGEHVARVLALFGRSWTAVMTREEVEVKDLTGAIFTDELAEIVDVNSASEDPAVAEPIVRETLVPLVLHRGRLVGKAVVNKSVPVLSDSGTEGRS